MANKNLYVNKKEADKIVNDITKQLDVISKSLSDISGLLDSIQSKKMLSDSSIDLVSLSKKCSTQSTIAEKSVYNIDMAYNSDLKDYAISLLDKRIAELESKISSIV